MEHTAQLVRTYMINDSPGDSELDEIVSDIASGKATLLHVVKNLGEFLTSENEDIRGKGVELLSSVLQKCPSDKLTKQTVHVLITFYCDKLDDVDTIIPALKGLVPLVSSVNCTDEDAIRVLLSLFQNINMRAHVQSNRLLVFKIVDGLLALHREALKNMGNDFLRGYLRLAEGEKDPRNLMIAFSIARVILIEFDISNCVDDFFDITFCYFPISFRPPPDDPYGITAEDLKKSLRSCLSATPRFGPLAIPLFLEKLSAGSGATKRDTMQTISECLPVYGTTVARDHANKLWSALKVEIFQPIDQETADCALETTQILIKLIYKSQLEDTKGGIDGIGKHIVEESLEYIKEPEKSKAKPAVKVMSALIQTTPFIRKYAVSKAVPCLIALFRDPAEITNRSATLTASETIIASVKDAFVPRLNHAEDPKKYSDEAVLEEFKDDLLGIFTVGLKTTATIPPSLRGLNTIAQIPSYLTDEELGFIAHNVNEVLEAKDVSADNRISALDVLSSISSISPKIVEDSTLPLLFSALPDTAPSRESVSDHVRYRQILDNLVSLCTTPSLFETFIIRLSTKLDLIFSRSNDGLPDVETNAAYVHYILLSISKTLKAKKQLGHVDIPKYVDRLLPRIYKLFVQEQQRSEKGTTISDYPQVVQVTGRVIEQIIQTVPADQQALFASSLLHAFLNGQVKALAKHHITIEAPVLFAPFTNKAQYKLVPLFTFPILALRKEIPLPIDDESDLVSKLAAWSLDIGSGDTEALSAMHAVASLINKRVGGLSGFLSHRTLELWDQYMVHEGKDVKQRRRLIRLWIWITKALMIRDDRSYKTYVDQLFSLFTNSTLSLRSEAAKALGEIGKGGEHVLTKNNFAVVKVLSVQKYFTQVLPRLVDGITSNKGDIQQQAPYLIALTSLIKPIPQAIYAHHMPKLLPLLLRGLELPDLELRIDVIETLRATSLSNNARPADEAIVTIISEHAPSIALAMLKNSQVYNQPLSSKLRQAALKYLGVLPEVVRYDILHPYKAQVLRELAICLDDPKRDVRKEAVDSRAVWFSYNG